MYMWMKHVFTPTIKACIWTETKFGIEHPLVGTVEDIRVVLRHFLNQSHEKQGTRETI
jgi:hypothetical protein